MITILFPRTPFVYLYSGLPFFLYHDQSRFRFTSDPEFVQKRDTNSTLIILRWFNEENAERPRDSVDFLKSLRDRYETIVLFDDDDSTSSPYWSLLPHVDHFWKKHTFRDLSLYTKPLYGNRIFTDYYRRTVGIEELNHGYYDLVQDPTQLSKVRPAWHLGVGLYPLRHLKDRLAKLLYPVLGSQVSKILVKIPTRASTFDQPKRPICQARYSVKGYTATVSYQRQLFSSIAAKESRVTQGFIARAEYQAEMSASIAVLSPFGWGEVCYRDFEAFRGGSVLIKPNMDHMDSWPNSYQPGKTYVPVRWDGTDLLEAISSVLDNPSMARPMCEAAMDQWADAFRHLDERVDLLLDSAVKSRG